MAEPLHIENNVHLEKLLTTDKTMEKEIRALVANVLQTAVREVGSAAAGAIKYDPRGTAHAVRKMLYKQVLGGNINILNKKKAGARGSVGSSVRGRTQRTEQIMSYQGRDRQFILRFLDSGTNARVTTHMNGRTIQRINKVPWHTYRSGQIGGRGSITPRGFFGPAAEQAIKKAATQLSALIEQLYKQRIND